MAQLAEVFAFQKGAAGFIVENFKQLITDIHHYWGHDLKLVHLLTMLSCELKRAISNYPLERVDLTEKLIKTKRMIQKCFLSKALSNYDNIIAVLLSDRLYYYRNNIVQVAQAFEYGPLQLALAFDLNDVTGTKQIAKLIDELFWSSLLFQRNFERWDDSNVFWNYLIALRTMCLSPRYCPAIMFIFEGLSKCFMLVIVGCLSSKLHSFRSMPNYENTHHSLATFLILLLFSNIAYYIGNLYEIYISLRNDVMVRHRV